MNSSSSHAFIAKVMLIVDIMFITKVMLIAKVMPIANVLLIAKVMLIANTQFIIYGCRPINNPRDPMTDNKGSSRGI